MASAYKTHGVKLTDGQKTKLHRAVKSGTPVSLKLSHASLQGPDSLPLTDTQIKHINKSYKDGSGYILNLSLPQLKHIVSGGFLPILLGALGALATGALSGAASYGATKLLKHVTGEGFGESYIQNASVVGKGVNYPSPAYKGKHPINYKKPIQQADLKVFHGGAHQFPPSYGMGVSQGFQGNGLFQYGQPTARGSGMVRLN